MIIGLIFLGFFYNNIEFFDNIYVKNFYSIICIALAIIFLWNLLKLKNEYFKKGTFIRLICDLVFIILLLLILLLNIHIIFPEYKNNFDYKVLKNFVILYILNSFWKNIVRKSYLILFATIIIMSFSGWLSIDRFLVVTLLVTVINLFLSDIKYLYGSLYLKVNKNKKNPNFDYNLVDEKKTKEKISTTKFLVNIFIVILYVYLVLCEWFESILIEEKSYTTYEYIIFRISLGEIRIGFLLLLIMFIIFFVSFFKMFLSFLKNIRFLKKMSFFYELDNYKRSIESFPINFIKKFVYLKKYVEIKKPNSVETNIKTSIHINSRKKFHRIYKYKNIEFHNKKPNSN